MSLARREIGSLPPHAKSEAGKRVNVARQSIQGAFDARLAELELERAARVLVEERVDVSLPWDRRPRGARHPLTTLMEHMGDLFVGMGYSIVDGPELELEWANFDALNIGPDNPVRGAMDTFYVDLPGLVMRTHTSPGQVRTMLTRQPPIYVVCPGRVVPLGRAGRHAQPGVPPDRGPRRRRGHHHGPPARHAGPLRPGHVRPGRADPVAAALLPVHRAVGGVRRLVRPAPRRPALGRVGGCGMVNPRVLIACGIDPERYSGFAFGMGVERTLMFRNGVSDMRDMVEGDVRFTRNFGMAV